MKCLSLSNHMLPKSSIFDRRLSFLLSEDILCKESILIMKKFDFEILTYLYILRPPQFFYAIFMMIYAFNCVRVCVYVSEHDSV